jgi:hypothetical protein
LCLGLGAYSLWVCTVLKVAEAASTGPSEVLAVWEVSVLPVPEACADTPNP